MAVRVLNNHIFSVETVRTSYVMGIDTLGVLRHLYYGPKMERLEDFETYLSFSGAHYENGSDRIMEEFSSFGILRGKETSFKVRYADGTRDFRYTVSEVNASGNALTLTLSDRDYPFSIELKYMADESHDIITRSNKAINTGSETVIIERLFSSEIAIPGNDLKILNVSGKWGMEQQLHIDPVSGGKKIYESNHGTTAFDCQPVFAVCSQADEDHGEVTFGVLSWSGNFKVIADKVDYGYMNVLLGVSDTELSMPLHAGETYETPKAYIGYTTDGFGEMSRMLHRFAKETLMTDDSLLPVCYNSWYATTFDVIEEEQMKLAEKAAKTGVELFVIDDGWFGKRKNDKAGLGDWYVDTDKFPNGLKPLIDHVHSLGMKFGLWIEPEMVNPDSDLYRAHPDWVYRYPRRKIVEGRNQYTLNLTNDQVIVYLEEVFDKLLTENAIDYVKWDMNRFVAEAEDANGENGMVWINHNRGFVKLAKALTAKHPNVSFEACAGGGSRVNYETLGIFDQFWPSDNTDPMDRARIQEGYTYFYPPKYMRAWVTDDEFMPLRMRSRCAMCGAYGIGSNLNAASEEELTAFQNEIEIYKKIRPFVQRGELYRLKSMRTDGWQAWEYTLDGEAVVITLTDHCQNFEAMPILKLKGLDPDVLYTVETEKYTETVSGACLMNIGIPAASRKDRDGTVVIIRKV